MGLRWVFVNGLKWVEKWFLGRKMGRKWSKPLLTHSKPISGFSRKPTSQPDQGGWKVFLKRALKQSRPSIKKGGFVKGWLWRTYPRSGLRSGERANVPSFRFSFQGNIRTYPCSGFRSGGTSAKTTLLETTLLSSPDNWLLIVCYLSANCC